MTKRQLHIYLGIVAIALTVAGGVVFLAMKASADTTDNMESYANGATITNATFYDFADFPDAGGSCCGNPSSFWEMDTGTFVAQQDSGGNKWGFLSNADLFRLNTQEELEEATVSWTYKTGAANNATDVWLNFQDQFWLYIIQFDRSDNCIVAKRKIPTNNTGQWGGPAGEISNKGVYYTLRLDADTPAHSGGPCNQDGLTWTQLGTTTIAHNATLNTGSAYNFTATIETIEPETGYCTGVAFDCTQLQLFRGDVLVASWTDKNDGWNVDKTRTTQTDCTAGWFTTVTGYLAEWCEPITAAGKSGFRNDSAASTWIDNFSFTGGSVEPPPPAIPVKTTSVRGTVIIDGGRIIQ